MLFNNRDKLIENGKNLNLKKTREDILKILSYSLDAINPYKIVKNIFYMKNIVINGKKFDISDFEKIYLIGFGKASIGMSQAVCDSINIEKGVVITTTSNYKVSNENISTFVGSHPLPNNNCIIATKKLMDLVKICNKNTNNIKGLCLHPIDIAVSKLIAGREKDLKYVNIMLKNNLIKKTKLENILDELSNENKKIVTLFINQNKK